MCNIKFNFKSAKSISKSSKATPKSLGYTTNDLNRICVYLHYYEEEKEPFYVGQGNLSRAFVFTRKLRNKSWNDKVKDISKIKVEIYKIDIDIETSIELEKELILKYGRLDNNTGILTNENDGGINAQLGEDNYFYGKQLSDENNGNYGNKYELNNLSKPVLQIDIFGDIVKEWASAREAEEKGGFNSGPISACCYGKRHIHKNYQWIFKDDYDETKSYEYVPGKTNSAIYLACPVSLNWLPIYVSIIRNKDQARQCGFNMKNIQQVCSGVKKSHKGFKFKNFFKLSKKEKLLYKDRIIIND